MNSFPFFSSFFLKQHVTVHFLCMCVILRNRYDVVKGQIQKTGSNNYLDRFYGVCGLTFLQSPAHNVLFPFTIWPLSSYHNISHHIISISVISTFYLSCIETLGRKTKLRRKQKRSLVRLVNVLS